MDGKAEVLLACLSFGISPAVAEPAAHAINESIEENNKEKPVNDCSLGLQREFIALFLRDESSVEKWNRMRLKIDASETCPRLPSGADEQ